MKRKKPTGKQQDDSAAPGRLEELVNRYFRMAEEEGVKSTGAFDEERVLGEVKRAIRRTGRLRTTMRVWWAAAASVAVIVCIFALLYRAPVPQSPVAMIWEEAGTGRLKQVKLDDGTVVWLNAGSRLQYPATFAADRREVTIEGEAYLEVSQDPARPFTVYTGNLATKVLGTSFNICAYPENGQVEVTVLTGKVSLGARSEAGTGTLLGASQQALYEANGQLVACRQQVDAAAAIYWRNNRLAYESKRLSQVAAAVSRWYGITVQVDDNVAACTISADFTGEPADKVLEVLARLVNGAVTHNGSQYRIKGKGCIY